MENATNIRSVFLVRHTLNKTIKHKPERHKSCDLCCVDPQTRGGVGGGGGGTKIKHFQAYMYISFVYRVVYVDMSTRSSQINCLNL